MTTLDDAPLTESTDRETLLTEQLHRERQNVQLMQESIIDLQLAMDDAGYRRLTAEGELEFTREGLRIIANVSRLMAIKNPLIRRALAIRTHYVWGQGVQVASRATGDDSGEQDVNAVVQTFLDDPGNVRVLTGQQAQEQKERSLGTDGNVLLACFTHWRTGRVQVRTVPFDEVGEVIRNPEDASEPWYYVRRWNAQELDVATGAVRPVAQVAYYPDIDYRPRRRPGAIGGHPVRWDSPIHHVFVNRPEGWKFGVGDVYPALDWARAYKEFLEDWARLCKALSRFAWRTTTKGSRVPGLAAKMAKAPALQPFNHQPEAAGANAVMDPYTSLEAIPKTGATLDSESGRPLAMMVAAATDVPVTMLLGDPGLTGSRATAETLDKPTELAMESRRGVWTAAFDKILGYVIDQAVKAPAGPLHGTVERDELDREVITLAGDTERTIEVTWPPLAELDPFALVAAIVAADGTGRIPPLTTLRLLLQALNVDDIDEVIDDVTDDQGNYIEPAVTAGDVAVGAFNRGEDPAAALNGQPAGGQPPATR